MKDTSAKIKINKIYILLMVYVAVLMVFCAGSSPFINYCGTDSSVFWLMGRGIAVGKVPYVDLFDHKGLYIYLFNYIGTLISGHSTWGLLCVEILFMCINAILLYKIGRIYLKDEFRNIVFVLLMLLFIVNYFTYQGGNLVEVYGITFQLLSIYYVATYYKNNEYQNHPPRYMLIHGINVGVVACLRLNLVFMWIGIGVVLIGHLFVSKEFKCLLKNMFCGFVGVLLGILPAIVWCIRNRCLKQMIFQSVLFNLRYAEGNLSVTEKIIHFMMPGYAKLLLVLFLVSLVVMIRKKQSVELIVMYVLSSLLSMVSVGMSGYAFGHYYEYLIPLLIPGALWLTGKINATKIRSLVSAGMLFCSVIVNLRTPIKLFADSASKEYVKTAMEMRAVYEQKFSSKKVLVVNNNVLFYNVLNVMPSIKYFYTPAISYEEFPNAVDAQADSIMSGKNDILIINYHDPVRKIIFNDKIDNEQLLNCLSTQYNLVYEKNGMEMYARR